MGTMLGLELHAAKTSSELQLSAVKPLMANPLLPAAAVGQQFGQQCGGFQGAGDADDKETEEDRRLSSKAATTSCRPNGSAVRATISAR